MGAELPDTACGRDYDEDDGTLPRLDERALYPPPTEPLDVARRLYIKYREQRARTLVCWRGCWMRWNVTHWSELDTAELRSHIYDVLGDVAYGHETKGDIEVRNWNPV
jgi:putative DNA primase/helicase